MSGRTFLDTNVLVYCHDNDEPEKQAIAQARLGAGRKSEGDRFVLSTQVLQDLYITLTRKLRIGEDTSALSGTGLHPLPGRAD